MQKAAKKYICMCCRGHLNNNVLKKQKKKNRKNSKKENLYNI